MSTKTKGRAEARDLETKLRKELLSYLFLSGRITHLDVNRFPMGIPESMADHMKTLSNEGKRDFDAYEFVKDTYERYLTTVLSNDVNPVEIYQINPVALKDVTTHKKFRKLGLADKPARNEYYRQFKPTSVTDVSEIFQVSSLAQYNVDQIIRQSDVTRAKVRRRIKAGEFKKEDIYYSLYNEGNFVASFPIEDVNKLRLGIKDLQGSIFSAVWTYKNLGRSKVNSVRRHGQSHKPVIISEIGMDILQTQFAKDVVYKYQGYMVNFYDQLGVIGEILTDDRNSRVMPGVVFTGFLGATLENAGTRQIPGSYKGRWDADQNGNMQLFGGVVEDKKHIVLGLNNPIRRLLETPCPVTKEYAYPSYLTVNEQIRLRESKAKLALSRYIPYIKERAQIPVYQNDGVTLRKQDGRLMFAEGDIIDNPKTYVDTLIQKQPKKDVNIEDIIQFIGETESGERYDRRLGSQEELNRIWDKISETSNYRFRVVDNELIFPKFLTNSISSILKLTPDEKADGLPVKTVIEIFKTSHDESLKQQTVAYEMFKNKTSTEDKSYLLRMYKQLDSIVLAGISLEDKDNAKIELDIAAVDRTNWYNELLNEDNNPEEIDAHLKATYMNTVGDVSGDNANIIKLVGEEHTKLLPGVLTNELKHFEDVGKNIDYLEGKVFFPKSEESEESEEELDFD